MRNRKKTEKYLGLTHRSCIQRWFCNYAEKSLVTPNQNTLILHSAGSSLINHHKCLKPDPGVRRLDTTVSYMGKTIAIKKHLQSAREAYIQFLGL
jgi:hypothetical protein